MEKCLETKSDAYYLYPSPREKDNKAITSSIKHLQTCGIDVVVISEGHVLDEHYKTPFLRTPEGRRIQGVEAIRQYARTHSI